MIIETDSTKYYYDIRDIKSISFEDMSTIASDPRALKNLTTLLNSIYPNPSSAGTTIEYSVDKYSLVKVDVFDLNGTLICPLQNKFLNAGHYTLVWDGINSQNRRVRSGTYLVRISADDKEITRKMMVINKGD